MKNKIDSRNLDTMTYCDKPGVFFKFIYFLIKRALFNI